MVNNGKFIVILSIKRSCMLEKWYIWVAQILSFHSKPRKSLQIVIFIDKYPNFRVLHEKRPFKMNLNLIGFTLTISSIAFSIEIMRFLNWIFDIMQSRANIVSSNRSHDLVIRIKFRLLCKNVWEFICRWESAAWSRQDQTFGSNQSSFYIKMYWF